MSNWRNLGEDRTLLCCRGKKCPVGTKLPDGGAKITDDDGVTITLSKEDVVEVKKYLETITGSGNE